MDQRYRRKWARMMYWPVPIVLLYFVLPLRSAASQEKASPIGEQCAACHSDLVKKFAATRHGKADYYKAWDFTESCASCHGDITSHVETADPAKITNPAKLKGAAATETCMKCHANQHGQAFWGGSAHEASQVNCLSCHSMHKAQAPEKLLAKRTTNETCLACHTDMRKAQFQRSTHLFRDELRRATMECRDCHNPHGSATEKMLRANSINDTCYQCHTEKRGPFLWEHSPVQESCLTCHSAHGSNNINLLSMRAPQLCQSCHIQGKHQTVSGFANSPWVLNRACLNCHSKIHGSNHPSGLKLQR